MRAVAATLLISICLAPSSAAQSKADTETVLATHRVREGQEAEYAKLLSRQWTTLRRLHMVLERPHVILRGADESGRTIFVEILTWKDHDTPDNAPPEVEEIWAEMERLAEKRLGHRGIEFPELEIVAMDDCPAATPPAR